MNIIFVMLIRLFIHCFIFYYFLDIGYKNQDQLIFYYIFLDILFLIIMIYYVFILTIIKLLIDIYNVNNSTTGPISIGSKNHEPFLKEKH